MHKQPSNCLEIHIFIGFDETQWPLPRNTAAELLSISATKDASTSPQASSAATDLPRRNHHNLASTPVRLPLHVLIILESRLVLVSINHNHG
ncbi:hypothetical protein Scep_001959 [Stephania cephalantha]|uniref:Uncharacterized protein n=1 Tax=Stephania cephalantha TaxID=152367 RepID=A0AAP0L956_9MAGN